jgi:hypothetical protein
LCQKSEGAVGNQIINGGGDTLKGTLKKYDFGDQWQTIRRTVKKYELS